MECVRSEDASKYGGVLLGLTLAVSSVMPAHAEGYDRAGEQQQEIIDVGFSASAVNEMKNSTRTGRIYDWEKSSGYMAWIKSESSYSIRSLQITKDGKTVKTVDMAAAARKALKLSQSESMQFYDLTCIKDVFYVTGSVLKYANGSVSATRFYVSTKDGSKVKVGKVNEQKLYYEPSPYETDSWKLYYSNGKYVAALDSIGEAFKDSALKKSAGYVYYISSDLKKWKAAKVKTFSKPAVKSDDVELRVEPCVAASKYMIFREVWKESLGYTYDYLEIHNYTYTPDFKSYKRISSLNKNITNGGKIKVGTKGTFPYLYGKKANNGKDCQLAVLYNFKITDANNPEYGMLGYRYHVEDVSFFSSKRADGYKKLFQYKGDYDWHSFYWIGDTLWGYFSNGMDYKVYIADVEKETCKEYVTSLDSRSVNDCDCKGEWTYFIYEGRYLLASKDGGSTIYRMDTGRQNLIGVCVRGKNLVLLSDEESDCYVPISAVQRAVDGK